jgi:hypothetical protein
VKQQQQLCPVMPDRHNDDGEPYFGSLEDLRFHHSRLFQTEPNLSHRGPGATA